MVRCSCLRVSSVLTRVGVCTRWIAAAAAQALMLVVDKNVSLTLTGMGDVIEPAADGIIGRNCTASSVLLCRYVHVVSLPPCAAIGSGGGFAHGRCQARRTTCCPSSVVGVDACLVLSLSQRPPER